MWSQQCVDSINAQVGPGNHSSEAGAWFLPEKKQTLLPPSNEDTGNQQVKCIKNEDTLESHSLKTSKNIQWNILILYNIFGLIWNNNKHFLVGLFKKKKRENKSKGIAEK